MTKEELDKLIAKMTPAERSEFFALVAAEKSPFRMATLEKAILDFFYLHPNVVGVTDLQSLRWSRAALAHLDFQQLTEFAKLFNAAKIDTQVQLLKTYLDG